MEYCASGIEASNQQRRPRVEERSGSIDRYLPPARPRAGSTRTSHPSRAITREVATSPCEQSRGRQSLAGMLVVEKNRCTRIGISYPLAPPFRGGFQSRQGQFQGQLWGQLSPRKLRGRLYLAFSRGEVAERLKAAVC